MIIGQLWRCPQTGLQPNKIKREILGEDVSFYSKEVSTGIPIKLWVLQLGRKKALNKSCELCWNSYFSAGESFIRIPGARSV